ncbi:SLC13 family permease [Oribacterium sp. WCC10]|uniref:SLC13 family permease n=1 Tax=Oribacterium sp. WCC10 TaxID=1855343 RepID=UPI0008EDC031|nr:SLC13 family permease [Oribacterium sp. WCC10]SFG13068.1 Di-and tricarboxylate transporter [Oribacterium sp. WCC10]
MTTQMILALAVLVLMIALIMFDVLPFGAPPILAGFLLVALGLADVKTAFGGFTNNSVVMIAGFMAVMAALQKTRFMTKLKEIMINLVTKGGYKSYAFLIIIVMAGAALAGGGSTGYYVLILSLITAIPYQKQLPTSKLMMPLGFATNHPLIPFNVALYFGVASTVLESAGWTGGMSMAKFSIVNFCLSLGFLVWALLAYKLLPDHPIQEPTVDQQKNADGLDVVTLTSTQENLTVVAFIASVVCMMLMNTIGDIAYVIPGILGFVLILAKVITFKEFRENYFAPVILMMAGVVGVADALANTGFTAMVGDTVAAALGTNANPFVVIFLFAVLTSTAACITGSNMGSVYIFAPIAVATCMALNLNPIAAAAAVTCAGWQGHYMPIDGLPALVFGMGKYSMKEFWKFTIPMYIIRLIFLCAGAVIIFPMK